MREFEDIDLQDFELSDDDLKEIDEAFKEMLQELD